jgi:Bifunctional DNA primase/polymerase, N-terminal
MAGALQVAALGVAVFPVWQPTAGGCACPDGARCSSRGKHPIITGWQADATTDAARIREWAARHLRCNWRMRTGREGGLAVLDVDPRSGGAEPVGPEWITRGGS